MIQEVEELINKQRKLIYKELLKKKGIKARAWFFIRQDAGVNDIMIPGVESMITDSATKRLLATFLATKWKQYSDKIHMELLAVVLMADSKFLIRPMPKDVDRAEFEKTIPLTSIVNNPEAKDVICFYVYLRDSKSAFAYPYRWSGKHVVWEKPIENLDVGSIGNLKDLFPK